MVLETAVILLVEDDPADMELTQYTIAKSKILVDLQVVGDGVEALAFLRSRGEICRCAQARPDSPGSKHAPDGWAHLFVRDEGR